MWGTDIAAGGFEILLAHAGHVEVVVRETARARELAPKLDNLRGERGGRWNGYRREKRAALIPVIGPLIPRGPVGLARFGVTSYEGLRDELREAAADPDVDTIVLMVDSPGGYVTGVDATADAILAARAAKPVVAVVEGMAASAAYWLASQADRIIVAPFGAVGSIGALAVHVEVSRALDAAGVTVSVMRAGARKAEANPLEPLGDEARAELQADLDKTRAAFADAVVAGRANPDLDVATVLATEARMLDADEAIRLGLADRIGSLDGFIDAMPVPAASRRPVPATIRRPVPAIVAAAPIVELAAEDRSIASVETAAETDARAATEKRADADTELSAKLGADPAAAERARIAAILALPEAKDRPKHAEEFAFHTDLDVDKVKAVLARLPREGAAAPTLAEEMAADIQPRVGNDGGRAMENLTAAEKGAVTAATLLGKNPKVVLAKMRGDVVQETAEADARSAASAPSATAIAPGRWPR